jgi:hypothetical protein
LDDRGEPNGRSSGTAQFALAVVIAAVAMLAGRDLLAVRQRYTKVKRCLAVVDCRRSAGWEFALDDCFA